MKKLLLIIMLSMNYSVQASLSAALLAGAGAFGLAHLFLSETEEQLLRRVQEEYKTLYTTYIDDLEHLQAAYGITVISVPERLRVLHNSQEEVVYNFALRLWKKGVKVKKYQYELQKLITQLNEDVYQLEKKKRGLRDKAAYNRDCANLLEHIEDIISRAHAGVPFFELLHDYLDYHMHYFTLFQEEDVIRKRYNYELNALAKYTEYPEIIRHKLLKAVDRFQSETNALFACTEYIERITRDIRRLKPFIDRADGRYRDRKTCAQQVCDALRYIKQLLMTDPAYQLEKREYARY